MKIGNTFLSLQKLSLKFAVNFSSLIFFQKINTRIICIFSLCLIKRTIISAPAFLEARLFCPCPSFPLVWCSAEVVPCPPASWWWWWWWWWWWHVADDDDDFHHPSWCDVELKSFHVPMHYQNFNRWKKIIGSSLHPALPKNTTWDHPANYHLRSLTIHNHPWSQQRSSTCWQQWWQQWWWAATWSKNSSATSLAVWCCNSQGWNTISYIRIHSYIDDICFNM